MKVCKNHHIGRVAATLCAALVGSGVLLLPVEGNAQTINLGAAGTTATLNVGGPGTIGMNSWVVSGQNQLAQQWFYYSLNGGVAQSIDTLGNLSYSSGASSANVTYANNALGGGTGLSANVVYGLTGGGGGNADMTEQLTIINTGTTSETLNFYQYSHFDLLQDPLNNEAFVGSGDGSSAFNFAYQDANSVNGSVGIQEAIDAPDAPYGEAEFVGGASDTLYNITHVANYMLKGNNDPLSPDYGNDTYAGYGDVTWAFEWSLTLAPGQMLDISKDKSLDVSIVPEPSTMALIALGIGALGFARRRLSA